MSTLQAALAWAARGFRVFPLREGTKLPLSGSAGWTQDATSDPATIERMWRDPLTGIERNYNIGVLTTGYDVLDIDIKEGKHGWETFTKLGLAFGDTLTVRTPSGGYHLYYQGVDAGNSVLGKDLDVRSRNAYVLAPGSYFADEEHGGKYAGNYELQLDLPIEPVPEQIRHLLKPPTQGRLALPGVDEDTPESIEAGIHYLVHQAPIAIEGQNGDNTTYRVAAKLTRDLALSNETALSIMLEYWNPRCAPPWTADELAHKIENAANYGTSQTGADAPEINLGGVVVVEPIFKAVAAPPKGLYSFNNVPPLFDVPERPWIVRRLLMRGLVTALIAPGSAGKTTLILTLLAHVALGKPFLGFKIETPGRSIFYSGEDDRNEVARRLYAICYEYGFDSAAIFDKIAIVTSEDQSLRVTKGAPPTLNVEHVVPLIEAASNPEVVVVALDPLVEIHDVDEGNNIGMKYVMATLRLIASKANVALITGHHTRKPGSAASGSYAGDADASRGASAITNSARVGLTLFPADPRDCERYGLKEEDRTLYVRLDDAKMNMSLASGRPVWLKKTGVTLINGDEVGVLVPHDMEEDAKGAAHLIAEVLYAEMVGRSMATLTIAMAVTTLMAVDPIYAQLGTKAVKSRIERALVQPVLVEGGARVGLRREKNALLVVVD